MEAVTAEAVPVGGGGAAVELNPLGPGWDQEGAAAAGTGPWGSERGGPGP